MKLSVSLLGRGRYWRAGEEIPDAEVPAHIALKYAVAADPHAGVDDDTRDSVTAPNYRKEPRAPKHSHARRPQKARKG